MSTLSAWSGFYVIVGSSAGALIGLTFVVISLIREAPQRNPAGLGAYTTPTIVHFGEVLAIAAALSAPWPTLASAAVALGLCGLGGLGYTIIVVRRLRRRLGYEPVLEDWLAHAVSPLVAYTLLAVAAVALPANPVPPLFAVGAVLLLLLFTGIHNAWDTVTWVTILGPRQATARDEKLDALERDEPVGMVQRDEATEAALTDETAEAAQRES